MFFASTRAGQRPRNVANDTVERANAVAIASMVSESTIERIFSRSVSLSSEAIVDFVTQLCRVSEQVCSRAALLFAFMWSCVHQLLMSAANFCGIIAFAPPSGALASLMSLLHCLTSPA